MNEFLCCCCDKKRNQKVSPDLMTSAIGSTTSEKSSESIIVAPIERKCTDVFFLVLNIAFVIALAVLISYCFIYGDIKRILNGFDDCGNVCGTLNDVDIKLGCKGADKRKEKFLLVEKSENPMQPENPYIHRKCVEKCENEGHWTFINRCIPKKQKEVTSENLLSRTGLVSFFQDISEDLTSCWKQMIYVCFISFAFSFIVLVLFRYVVGFVVWIVLIASVLIGLLATIFLWIKYGQNVKDPDSERVTTYLISSIIATIVTVLIALLIFVMRKRIDLVIQLFSEAGKAIADMPMLLFEPLLTFTALIGTIALWFYFALIIESAGKLQVHDSTTGANGKISYVKDGVIKSARWMNIFAFLWFTTFLFGCQDFIIAGSVSKWFFTRNKNKKLNLPIITTFGHLIRYHLGSICFGSVLIAIVQFARITLKIIENTFENSQNRIAMWIMTACKCCLMCFENFIQYLSKNAYVIITINGSSFCVASKRAFKLLSSNALQVLAINSVGDFVLLLGKIFVVTATVLIAIEMIQNIEGLHYRWIPVLLCGIFAFLVSHCFLTVYEMTIDTIFLCFCEDCEQNDGINRPYYMSRNLMEFVQNSKQSFNNISGNKKNAWNSNNNVNVNGIQTVA
ncbi:hypothetical protein PVAND_003622 [Polypedilum vanderplanki]|uniref:Choline transporter-like protein n=1 Tax=Polypedilum vanderplanki TaxID=319348 RepID=A0A9J6BVN1_POLVA|nr:hypothetical protein PVAND_003622 [Polypedilum vanderplanki]